MQSCVTAQEDEVDRNTEFLARGLGKKAPGSQRVPRGRKLMKGMAYSVFEPAYLLGLPQGCMHRSNPKTSSEASENGIKRQTQVQTQP